MNEKLTAIIVSVEFADLLAITLPYNRHHFARTIVVTTLEDTETQRVAKENGASLFLTNSFYEDGAVFNKGKAIEESFELIRQNGWVCLMDVDVLWPKVLLAFELKIGCLHGPKRRVMEQIESPIPEDWARFPHDLPHLTTIAGYTQIFHTSDPHLGSKLWYETDWTHAGGADSAFQAKWPRANKIKLPFSVLHLGKVGMNWCGRVQPHVDGRLPEKIEQRKEQLTFYTRKIGYPRRGPHEKITEG